MQEAVNYGLKVLDSAFEHLDIKAGNSDSEDEEVTDKVEAILEPKVGLESGRMFNPQPKIWHISIYTIWHVCKLYIFPRRIFTWTDPSRI